MQDKLNKIVQADCLEYLKELPDKCVNLVLIDPPYNISHAKWDKWKCQKEYVNWLGSVFVECQRVLKDNGSFYFWHNDFQQMAELQHWILQNTRFIFKSIITVEKLDGSHIIQKFKKCAKFRNFINLNEYLLFYVLQDDNEAFAFKEYLDFMTEWKIKYKLSYKEINEYLSYKSISSHWFWNSKNKQPSIRFINIKDFKKLNQKWQFENYEHCLNCLLSLHKIKYTFNAKEGQVNLLKYFFNKEKNRTHSAQKPQDLLQQIILTSSNENDIVLDCFAGSGSTALAAINTKRNFLCCEQDADYVKIANNRLLTLNHKLF